MAAPVFVLVPLPTLLLSDSDVDGGERTPVEGPHVLFACLAEGDVDEEDVGPAVAFEVVAVGTVPLRRLLRLGPPTNLNSRGVWTWAMLTVFSVLRCPQLLETEFLFPSREYRNAWRGNRDGQVEQQEHGQIW